MSKQVSFKRQAKEKSESSWKIRLCLVKKGGPGRGRVIDSNRGDVDVGAGVHTPDDSDEDSFM